MNIKVEETVYIEFTQGDILRLIQQEIETKTEYSISISEIKMIGNAATIAIKRSAK